MKPAIPIPRPSYERALLETVDNPAIKVLTGIRRCGKSTLLKMFSRHLTEEGLPESNILYRSMDSFGVPLEPDAQWLDSLLAQALDAADGDHPLYVFLDEIQEVPGWERPLRRLHSDGRARIYLTGSNAFLLSSDLATYLSGRYVELPVYPLSYNEFSYFSERYEIGAPADSQRRFSTYLRFGGMPGLFDAHAFDATSAARELTAIRDTVLLNDVAKRFNIRDINLLEKLMRYVYSTSGNLFSANRVSGALTSMGRKTNAETVDNYLDALKRAFALYECVQCGLRGKEVLQPQRKYYAPDTGLRNLSTGFAMQDVGFQLENAVYIELLRRGYEVSVGKLPTGEIDFVAVRQSERIYIQVCDSLLDEKTMAREVSSLDAVNDAFPKLLLTRDPLAGGVTDTGVRIEQVEQWLFGEEPH